MCAEKEKNVYICFTFDFLVSLFVGFVLHPLACLFLSHFAFEKEPEPARYETRPLTFISHLYLRSFRLVSSLQQLILYSII